MGSIRLFLILHKSDIVASCTAHLFTDNLKSCNAFEKEEGEEEEKKELSVALVFISFIRAARIR